ncbi:high light inducible protein [Cyanophage P-TIM40]|uniref:High light inducible protein n=1 Tax=Cyanophage P-TIM40 TaxID=1589733 RepID=A0A0C5AJ02_9CAUD|nr:high light inducible protein [Cyanophage P-TIM40]AJK27658.1 high light inducible protein [Cyanophage P-TIM40]|tara:strand:+ start:5314 stop:5514 length:201 start_codon:yes stop_codon:yes gene_type:complete
MTVITEDRGRQNMFAKEPPMQVMDVSVTHNEKAELLNGRLAMLGIISAVISYAVSGSIFFFGAFGI